MTTSSRENGMRITRCAIVLTVASLVVFVLGAGAAFAKGPAPSSPKRLPTAKPFDCRACHAKPVLPADHDPVKDMKLAECVGCHDKTGDTSLRGKLPTSHTHALAGVGCAKCHGKTKKPQAVAAKKCTSCHEAKALALKTAKVKPSNPHDSPHYGPELDCTICHHQHAKPENYCLQCHDFKFSVP